MSEVVTSSIAPPSRSSLVAFVLALGAACTWLLATPINDALFVVAAAVGAVAAAFAWKARSDTRRAGANSGLAVAALIIGGLVTAQVLVYTAVWGISELV